MGGEKLTTKELGIGIEQEINMLENAVEENYKVNWNKNCKSESLEDGCNLPSKKADAVDENRRYLMDGCFKKYPQ